jgi:hypothetical protein
MKNQVLINGFIAADCPGLFRELSGLQQGNYGICADSEPGFMQLPANAPALLLRILALTCTSSPAMVINFRTLLKLTVR